MKEKKKLRLNALLQPRFRLLLLNQSISLQQPKDDEGDDDDVVFYFGLSISDQVKSGRPEARPDRIIVAGRAKRRLAVFWQVKEGEEAE
ncbi:hypothetical protein TYRP_011743 [Tyrophagus putrescentiae]|nr:hypothetical protein TYRP_011743 [Tyrophagus putrescentiae]